MSQRENKITLIGAGLAGSLLSIHLARRGFQVEVYERRPDMRKTKISAGRSINLALSVRGIHALNDVGLHEDIMRIAIPMKGRMIHALDGALAFQPYGRLEHEVIHAVSRAQLNICLLDAAERHDGVRIYFNQTCTGMNLKTGEVNLHNEISGEDKVIPALTVIGTDGSASAIRMEMLKTGRFNFSQQYLEHGYKELVMPAGPNGEFLLEKNALHIWPRHTYMLIALPNLDGSFTCTFFFPFEGEESFASLNTEEKVLSFFQKQFPDAVPLMPTLVEDFFTNPTGAMVTIKCNPWYVEDKVVLLGDAAHAIVPFFGQGMNCAFEDCTYLDACIEKHGDDWKKVFEEYEELRKINTDAIADMALENFIEMRDHTADPKFLLKKKVERALEEKFPEVFIPKYSMVSFHRIPYSVALARGIVQDKILAELCSSINDGKEVDWTKVGSLIRKELVGKENFP
jgi:kynurenine 3-monooxygenase